MCYYLSKVLFDENNYVQIYMCLCSNNKRYGQHAQETNHDFLFFKSVKMWLTAVGFALAMTKKTPACSAFVIQIFVPLRMK